MPLALILAVGHDGELLETRSYILRSAGYAVNSVASAGQAIRLFHDGDFDLVLLCHSIPVREREWICSSVRGSSPRTPVLSIVPLVGQDLDFVDGTAIDGAPEKLLRGISEVLANASMPYDSEQSIHPAEKRPPSRSVIRDNSKRDEA